MSSDVCEYLSVIFSALSHPKRVKILRVLQGGRRTVNEIAAAVGLSQPSASQHLQVLRSAGLVASERIGNQCLYRVADQRVLELCRLAQTLYSDRLKNASKTLIASE